MGKGKTLCLIVGMMRTTLPTVELVQHVESMKKPRIILMDKRSKLVIEKDTLCMFSLSGGSQARQEHTVDSGSINTSSPRCIAASFGASERRSAMNTMWQIVSEGSFCITGQSRAEG